MIWHVFSAIRGIVVGVFMTEYRKRRYSRTPIRKSSQDYTRERNNTRNTRL